ncbi:hypothetical protein [Sphingomonas profundi]|uniref:hypothetical protein n=1 Tax=Alterirhizorhabdus profundi TaxID=2681549 RepID=UPI0012E70190|nr:hypothetical protein [Sphingomonas profundi]
MSLIDRLAPTESTMVEYDRRNLALYAALLDADNAGCDWQDTASSVLRLDVSDDHAKACWRSHLERARWIVGEGLANALLALNERPPLT